MGHNCILHVHVHVYSVCMCAYVCTDIAFIPLCVCVDGYYILANMYTRVLSLFEAR